MQHVCILPIYKWKKFYKKKAEEGKFLYIYIKKYKNI